MTDRLFVYGSLAPGQSNQHVLADVVGSWERASVRGRLFHHGWGVDLGYPALELDPSGELITGLVFTAVALPEHWQRLDDFEGANYQRLIARVQLETGGEVEAYLYAARGPAPG